MTNKVSEVSGPSLALVQVDGSFSTLWLLDSRAVFERKLALISRIIILSLNHIHSTHDDGNKMHSKVSDSNEALPLMDFIHLWSSLRFQMG